jgi:hypothetical protein
MNTIWNPMWTAPLDGTPILVVHPDMSGVFAVRCGEYVADGEGSESRKCWFTLTWDDVECDVGEESNYFTGWATMPHGPWDDWNLFDDFVKHKSKSQNNRAKSV